MIPHLRLPQDVYVRLYSSISDATGFQAILYGVCEECLGQGLVARVKGLIPYYSYGSELEALLASIVARSDVTILGIAVVPDEQTSKLSTTHEIASSYLLALQTALVRVVTAARSSGHTDDGYFNQKVAKECAAWFRDLVNYENFCTRLRFFVNASITANDVLATIQCKSTYDTTRLPNGKSIPLNELNNTTFDGLIGEYGTINNNNGVVHNRFTRKGRARKSPVEDKETSTTMERGGTSNGYDEGDLANNEANDGDEEMEEGLESDDEGGDNEEDDDDDNEEAETEAGDATMSDEAAGSSRQHTPLDMESNDPTHSTYYSAFRKNRQLLSRLNKRKTAMCATGTGSLKLPRLIKPRLNEKFTIEKGQETSYLHKALGGASLINCTNEDERDLAESVDILLEGSTSDRLERLERKQHALEGIIRKLGGKIDTYAESHQEYMGLVYLWQWLSLPSEDILRRLDTIAIGQPALSSDLPANNRLTNLEVQTSSSSSSVLLQPPPLQQQQLQLLQPLPSNGFANPRFIDEHNPTSSQYSRQHSHYSRRSANRPRDPDSTDTEPEPELLSLNYSAQKTTATTTTMDVPSTSSNVTPANTVTPCPSSSNSYITTTNKPLRKIPAPTSDLYTLASIALPSDPSSDTFDASVDATIVKSYADAVNALTSEPVSDSPLPSAQH
ncbi:hypothetical protein BDF22DRAFT_697315 [Syncephalis plumigaleata]|nr:hypothetical protein BDF22DRAFT_697315 [Syncephalis plumigaleata]